jgi:cellulose synthase/poly-beta-1,6-N-acetylglucosamine synthase-like glycosyltransferase
LRYAFYSLILLVFYTYFGYFAIIYAWSKVAGEQPGRDTRGTFEPFVSVVIAARDEARHIEDRICNILAQDYPAQKIETIVVSDGSRDQTDKLVQNLAERLTRQDGRTPVRLITLPVPQGKPTAINTGVASAHGEIVVFTDARQRFAPDAVAQLVGAFESEDVGCASGELIFEKTPGSMIAQEMGAYWKFEKNIRRLESKTGSVVGATGSIYAIRRALFRPIPPETLLDDVLIPLTIRDQGFRVIFQSAAKAFDNPSQDFRQEKRRKIRTLAGNWQLLMMNPKLLSPCHNPFFFKFVSHKVLRLLVPYALIGICFLSLALPLPFLVATLALFAASATVAITPLFPKRTRILSRVGAASRAFWFLNYTALLAPFFLLSRQKLWR